MRNNRAFTLIEICVVLCIVMILAALLLPVFGRVRERGRQAACQSNLHQLFLGLSQYVSDYDAHFPNSFQWKEGIGHYTKGENIFFCPDVSRPLSSEARSQMVDEGTDYVYSIWWLNSMSFVPSTNGGLPAPRMIGLNESATLDIEKLPVLFDVGIDGNIREVPLPRTDCGWTAADGTPTTSIRYSVRHSGGLNVLFYDGQVKWMSPEQKSEMDCDLGRYAQPPFRIGGPHISLR